jgi:hypothetical protein
MSTLSSKQRNLGPKQPPRIHGERCICGDNGTNPRCPVKDYKPPAKPSNQWDEDPMNNLIMPGSRYELSGYCAACKRKWNLTCQTGTEVLVKSFHCECGHVTEMEGRAAVEPSVDVKQMNRDLCAKDGHVLGVTARPCLRCHEWFDPIYGTEQMRKDTLENASPETAPEIVEWKNVDTGETGTLCTLCGHEQNPNQSPSADIEALLESFVWAVRRDNDNGDQYTRQEVKDLRAELLAAIRAVQPPQPNASHEPCEHSALFTYDSVGVEYRAPCPWCLQLELTGVVAERAAEPPVVLPERVFDLTCELRRYFDSGLFQETTDLYLLLKEIEAMRPTVTKEAKL